ncbi:hypothetical protein ASPZODRAFT_17653 [Penicilliopsis zonata CBS 506.65]|uniref:Alpha/beta hydrolase fold-3 domain-containing protein n=1 Tax=Penicilliopsis zonata CBS 506.65 TaxID=1073090 RepID=A0A1L9SE09_9EURO|nr:hypothetical protein ASPZODRAFT_17653 [Penicilliopsis zonata CBS 506.65]OJJ45436.1 hypothetical protein ASPZODRAFT_17653 [Penicilliopsis zonata CBS 506.65]
MSFPELRSVFFRLSRTRPVVRSASQPLTRANVILYLPPGPLFRSSSHPENEEHGRINRILGPDPAHLLASTTSSTVVTVNYRLGAIDRGTVCPSEEPAAQQPTKPAVYKYPTPIHDTLAGLDWVAQNLQPAQLCVLGTHVGGSLALMLALTEAQTVSAVAAIEPVCDWAGLDEYCTAIAPAETPTERQRRGRFIAPPDLVPLLQARETLFDTPERYFDAFASPILFLRSPGKGVPRSTPRYMTGAEYPRPVLVPPPQADRHQDLQTNHMPEDLDGEIGASSEQDSERITRRRKALSRWPPYGLDYGLEQATYSPHAGIRRLEVTLPRVRIYTGSNELPRDKKARTTSTVLAQQAEEMVSVMRRACFFGREKGFGDERVQLGRVEDVAEAAGCHALYQLSHAS